MHVGEAEAVFAGFDDEGFDFVLEQLAALLARGDGGFGDEGGDNLVRASRRRRPARRRTGRFAA